MAPVSIFLYGDDMNKKSTFATCDDQASDVDIAAPSSILEYLPLLPFELTASLAGKSIRPFLAELTGISASHLRRGKECKLRESTERKLIDTAKEKFHKQAEKQGWSEKEITTYLESAPSIVSGHSRPFADLIHGLQIPGVYEFPQATAFAEEVDLIISKLLDAHRGDDLVAFKQVILDCVWREVLASQEKFAQQMEALQTASDWDATLSASQQFILNMLFCFFSALDAEFGLIYFSRLESRPLFLIVMPKLNSKVDLDSLDKIPKRNFVYQPVRRLLELSHALMVWGKDQCWPHKPVGRKELGKALGLDDQYIGNYFDGTRNMDAASFESYWIKMCGTVADCKPFNAPMPLLLAAIFWQSMITRYPNQKLKSFILPDKETYTLYWKWHHQRWASELNKGAVGWPIWLDD